MPALPTLYPQTPDGTATTMNAPVGAATYAEALQTSDGDTSYVTSGLDSAGSVFLNFTDMPADFGTMETLSVSCVVRLEGTRTDDTTGLYAQVFAADETTALTDEVFVTDHTTGNTYTIDSTAMVLTATGAAGEGKATWDGARLRLRWVFVKTGKSDAIALRVTQAYLDGTYKTSTPTTYDFDFNDMTVGADLYSYGWQRGWNTGDTSTIVASPLGGNAVRYNPTTANRKYTAPPSATIPSLGDADVSMRWRLVPGDGLGETVSGDFFRLNVSASGAAGAENAIFTELSMESDGRKVLDLRDYKAGASTIIQTNPWVWEADVWYWWRIRKVGDTVYYKHWRADEAEPTAWLNSTTTTLGKGFVGWGSFATGNYDIDFFSVGTYGAESTRLAPIAGAAVTVSMRGTATMFRARTNRNFGEYSVGDLSATGEWEVKWDTADVARVLESYTVLGNQYAYLDATSGTRKMLAFTPVGSVADADVRMRFQFKRLTPEGPYLVVRGDMPAGATAPGALIAQLREAEGLTIRGMQTDNTIAAIGTAAAFVHTGSTWYQMRLRVVGTTASAKVWVEGALEPTNWMVTGTVTNAPTTGNIGIGWWTGPQTVLVDAFSYGLNGDEAPPLDALPGEAAIPIERRHPAAPTGLTVVDGGGGAQLTWNAVEGAEGYKIVRDEVVVGETADTTYFDTVVGQHTWRVKAYRRIV